MVPVLQRGLSRGLTRLGQALTLLEAGLSYPPVDKELPRLLLAQGFHKHPGGAPVSPDTQAVAVWP